jgi:hypothetical protein
MLRAVGPEEAVVWRAGDAGELAKNKFISPPPYAFVPPFQGLIF